MDFVTRLLVSTNWKGQTYNLILVIVNRLTKMVHYEPIKVTIDISGRVEIIIEVIVRHHGLPDSIVSDQGAVLVQSFRFHSATC